MHAKIRNMRKIGYIIILLAVCLSVYAAPARRGWMPRVLADGTEVEVQQYGDEYYHFMVTKDGKMVEETGEGLRITDEPVPTQEQVAARRALRAPKAVGKPNLAPRGLVILASFSDLPIAEYNTSISIDSMMNISGYDYHGSTGSARDYFIAQSDSQYMPIFDVVGPVTLPHNRAYYGGGYPDANPKQMIVDACQLVDDVVDFTQYNNDNDSYVDFVYVIYAGIGENDRDGELDAVWAHNGSVSSKNCIVDGLRVSNYACSGDIDGITKDRNGIGVLCHEFSHVIGLPDYYSTNGACPPIFGEWSIMDYGCYNHDALTPPNYSIFDKYFMGWATPEVLKKDSAMNVVLSADYDDAYQITGGDALLPYSTTNTVYYIENRQNTGWDTYLPGHGMLVWRVSFNQSSWNNNRVNYTMGSPRYTVYSAANGLMTNGDNVWSTAADPFPGTGNVTEWTPFEGCALTEITEVNGQITFKLNGGAPVDPTDVEVTGDGLQVTGKKIIRNGQLIIVRGEKEYNAQGAEIR